MRYLRCSPASSPQSPPATRSGLVLSDNKSGHCPATLFREKLIKSSRNWQMAWRNKIIINYSIKLEANTRVDRIDTEFAICIIGVGCREVWIGNVSNILSGFTATCVQPRNDMCKSISILFISDNLNGK